MRVIPVELLQASSLGGAHCQLGYRCRKLRADTGVARCAFPGPISSVNRPWTMINSQCHDPDISICLQGGGRKVIPSQPHKGPRIGEQISAQLMYEALPGKIARPCLSLRTRTNYAQRPAEHRLSFTQWFKRFGGAPPERRQKRRGSALRTPNRAIQIRRFVRPAANKHPRRLIHVDRGPSPSVTKLPHTAAPWNRCNPSIGRAEP